MSTGTETQETTQELSVERPAAPEAKEYQDMPESQVRGMIANEAQELERLASPDDGLENAFPLEQDERSEMDDLLGELESTPVKFTSASESLLDEFEGKDETGVIEMKPESSSAPVEESTAAVEMVPKHPEQREAREEREVVERFAELGKQLREASVRFAERRIARAEQKLAQEPNEARKEMLARQIERHRSRIEAERAFEQTEKLLETAPIAESKVLGDESGVNASMRLRFEGSSETALYKPASGEEEKLAQFIGQGDAAPMAKREAAMYMISRALFGADNLVPATVLREGEQGMGSVQHWEQDDTEKHKNWRKDIDQRSLERAALFDYATDSVDRKADNFLVNENGEMRLIDNGFSLLQKEQAGTQIPRWRHIEILTQEAVDASGVTNGLELLFDPDLAPRSKLSDETKEYVDDYFSDDAEEMRDTVYEILQEVAGDKAHELYQRQSDRLHELHQKGLPAYKYVRASEIDSLSQDLREKRDEAREFESKEPSLPTSPARPQG